MPITLQMEKCFKGRGKRKRKNTASRDSIKLEEAEERKDAGEITHLELQWG
jgi:hypothetical protein